jgi:hypothetical protein
MLEYTIEHDENGKYGVCLNNYAIMDVYYSTDRCQSPISKEKAEEWANTFKCMIESEYPSSEIDEEKYENSSSSMEDLLKLMLLKRMME